MQAVYTVTGRESAKKRIFMMVHSTFSEEDTIHYEKKYYKRNDFLDSLDDIVKEFPDSTGYLIIGFEEHVDDKTNKKIEKLYKKISKEIFNVSKKYSKIIKLFRKEATKIAKKENLDIKTSVKKISEDYDFEKKNIELQNKKKEREINKLEKKKEDINTKIIKIKKEIDLIKNDIDILEKKRNEYITKNKKTPKKIQNSILKKRELFCKKDAIFEELVSQKDYITKELAIIKRKKTIGEKRLSLLKASKDFESFIKEMVDAKNAIKDKYEGHINDLLAAGVIKQNIYNLYIFFSYKI